MKKPLPNMEGILKAVGQRILNEAFRVSVFGCFVWEEEAESLPEQEMVLPDEEEEDVEQEEPSKYIEEEILPFRGEEVQDLLE